MKLTDAQKKHLPRVFIGLCAAALVYWLLLQGGHQGRTGLENGADQHAAHTPATPSKKTQLYVCPMNDTPPKTAPGNCPVCGMKLVPMPEDSLGEDLTQPTMTLSASARKLAEVEVAPVRRGFAEVELRLAGKVGYDETRERVISAWVPGRLEKVFVDNTGTVVHKGEPLVEIYSQKLNGEKAVYLSTLRDKPFSDESPERRKQLNRARLMLLGLTSEQIDELEKRPEMKYTELILSPLSGTVVEKEAKEGMYVNEGQALYKVADLSRVWVWLEAYEGDLPFIRYGQEAQIRASAYTNETFSGMVSFIDPVLNDMTRTARVRVQVENTEFKLKPNMIVRAVIQTRIGADGGIFPPERLRGKWVCPRHPEVIRDAPGRCEESGLALLSAESLGYVTRNAPHPALLVPASAVLVTGKRGYVYREDKLPDRTAFTGVEIELGSRAGADYVVRSGLREGDVVAVNGAFRIDSAMQLSSRPSMMRSAEITPSLVDKKAAAVSASVISAPASPAPPLAAEQSSTTPETEKVLATTPELFRTQLTQVVKQYFKVQRALGDDAPDLASQEVTRLATLYREVSVAGLTSPQKQYWQNELNRLDELTAAYAKSKDIEEQRTVFSPLSAVMEDLVRALGGLPGVAVYRAFCPMAFGNNGAFWVQEGKTIHNPYEGKRMLNCGVLKEQLTGQ